MKNITHHFQRYFPWAIAALKRDHYKCVQCGSEEYVVVHHLDESRKKRPEKMNNNLKNLMTLCKPCHADIHKQTLRFTKPSITLITELRNQGKTFQFIGSHLGISRQRVHQIIKQSSNRRVVE